MDSTSECPICQETILDKISMTCNSQHSLCFKCLLENIEVNSELKSCPICRGGDKFIMFNNEQSDIRGFYSIDYFKKSLPILQKILNNTVSNTCLISDILLITYVKNKKQLQIAHTLISFGQNIDEIIPYINWKITNKLENTLNNTINNAFSYFGSTEPINNTFSSIPIEELFGTIAQFTTPSPQRQTEGRNDRPNRPQRERIPPFVFGPFGQ